MTDPALAVSVTGRGRMYRHPVSQEFYPSITNIIDTLAKPWLGAWAAKETARYAYQSREAIMAIDDEEAAVDLLKGAIRRKRDAAAKLGSTIHDVAEKWAEDRRVPEIPPEGEPFVQAWLDFVADYEPEFLVLEGTVFSDEAGLDPEHGYAGTFDFLARIGGALILGDYKTGSGIYAEIALQFAAERNAAILWDKHSGNLSPMPPVDGCIGVHLRPEGHGVYAINAGERAYRCFLGLREAWPWHKDDDRAIGPRMSPERLVAEFSSGAGEPTAAGSRAADRAAAESGDGPAESTQRAGNDEDPAPDESSPARRAKRTKAGSGARQGDDRRESSPAPAAGEEGTPVTREQILSGEPLPLDAVPAVEPTAEVGG